MRAGLPAVDGPAVPAYNASGESLKWGRGPLKRLLFWLAVFNLLLALLPAIGAAGKSRLHILPSGAHAPAQR